MAFYNAPCFNNIHDGFLTLLQLVMIKFKFHVVLQKYNYMPGTWQTEVRLDGWCEGGLGQQRNDGGDGAKMHERSDRVKSPGTYVTE